MKVSARVDYACKALVELVLHWPHTHPLQVQAIAKHQDIPIKFLIHILIYLKQCGFVKSVRGKKGGYILAKPPAEISLAAVLSNFDGEQKSGAKEFGKGHTNIMGLVWQETDETISKVLSNVTFEQIGNRARDLRKNISYEI